MICRSHLWANVGIGHSCDGAEQLAATQVVHLFLQLACGFNGLFGVLPVSSGNQPAENPGFRGCYHRIWCSGWFGFSSGSFRLPCGTLLHWRADVQAGETVRRERTLRKHLEELQRMKEMLANMLVHDLNSPSTA